jgi:hypothetical protein
MNNERLSFEVVGFFQNCLSILSRLCQGKVKGLLLFENVSAGYAART